MYLADDYASFVKVNIQLLNPPTPLKHVPIRIYMPSSPPNANSSGEASIPGSFKVMQSLVPPRLPNRKHPLLLHLPPSIIDPHTHHIH